MSFYGMPDGRRVTMRDLAEATIRGEKWPMITAYDAMTARIFDEAGIPAHPRRRLRRHGRLRP